MSKQTINIGALPSDGSGDPIRVAFDKINDNFDELYAAGGLSGFSGYSGAQGPAGGASGYSGFSSSVPGASGFSGFSGQPGGYSGYSGLSGYSGYSSASGYSGFSGKSGYSGIGISGKSGFSGASGWSGFSGPPGPAGGVSGYSGFSGVSGVGFSGYSGYSGNTTSSAISITYAPSSTTTIAYVRDAIYYVTAATGATTWEITGLPSTGTVGAWTVEITNGGSQTQTWFTGIKWEGGVAPTLTTSGVDVLTFYTRDGGTTIFGFIAAKDIK